MRILDEVSYKAQKRYQCSLCCQGIKEGAKYRRQVLVYDKDFYTNRYHPQCRQILDAICEDPEWNPPWDDPVTTNLFWEYVEDKGIQVG